MEERLKEELLEKIKSNYTIDNIDILFDKEPELRLIMIYENSELKYSIAYGYSYKDMFITLDEIIPLSMTSKIEDKAQLQINSSKIIFDISCIRNCIQSYLENNNKTV